MGGAIQDIVKMNKIEFGDCLAVLRTFAPSSIDAIVTDPPYGLSFMGKKWDYDVPSVEVWAECLRVLKPGGHLLAFAGTRTQHRMAVRIEDAGFDIRDMIAWVYGSGFPKSLDVSKAIDAKLTTGGSAPKNLRQRDMGADYRPHELAGTPGYGDGRMSRGADTDRNYKDVATIATDDAREWQGWGTALKPALEPITVARKPLAGTVAENVLQWGCGGLNIDGCRVEAPDGSSTARKPSMVKDTAAGFGKGIAMGGNGSDLGRWPANLIHDGSEEVTGLFPHGGAHGGKGRFVQHAWAGREATEQSIERSEGSAARFFYCAKASKRDRDAGNNHPTVKPTDLMRYLCRLVTPPGGVVLDPFMGSGSTGKAAMLEGFQFIGIERDPAYFEVARERLGLPDELY